MFISSAYALLLADLVSAPYGLYSDCASDAAHPFC